MPSTGFNAVTGRASMTELQFFEFSWEGTDNPNDPSGVACLTVGSESVTVPMHSLPEAAKLCRLIEKACNWQKQQTIDRAISRLSNLYDS